MGKLQAPRKEPPPPPPKTPIDVHHAPPTRTPPRLPPQNPSVVSLALEEPSPSKLQKLRGSPPSPMPIARTGSPANEPIPIRRSRGNSLLPPPKTDGPQVRSVSSPLTSRPNSVAYMSDSGSIDGHSGGTKVRKSFFGGRSRSRNTSQDTTLRSAAWISVPGGQIDYGLNFLLNGEKVPEIYEESSVANMYVYLFPREAGRGAQFKCPSLVVQCSQPLLDLMNASQDRSRSFDGRNSLTPEDAQLCTPPMTLESEERVSEESQGTPPDSAFPFPSEPPRDLHLYFPVGLENSFGQLSKDDVQKLVDVRNLFAFFNGQPLVATPLVSNNFQILVTIAHNLRKFGFTDDTGSTFGYAAWTSFNFYIEEQRLADVRESREKCIEALILGEKMRCQTLYSEGFAHAVGKLHSLKSMKSPLWDVVSHNTRTRIERSAMELKAREQSIAQTLTAFDFPALFSGIAASKMAEEAKMVKFQAWRLSFEAFRKRMISYLKQEYGQWPPKASSKKNSFQEGGLNRLVLKTLYADLCGLYDYLVDREAITTRGLNESDDAEVTNVPPPAAALRKLLSEYDRSSPPVKPPIPFDVPLLPTMASITPQFINKDAKTQLKLSTKRLKDNEMGLVLAKSHNLQSDSRSNFMTMFKVFEEKEGKHKSALELVDQRIGYWIFMYAVIQALPLLTTDAPGLQFTNGVETFLCQMPMGNMPWNEDAGVKTGWYSVGTDGGVVELPSDMVDNGVEAVYRRSHCWKMADKWLQNDFSEHVPEGAMDGGALSPLAPPPGFGGGELGARPRGREGPSSRDRASSAAALGGSGHDSLSPLESPSHLRPRSQSHNRNSMRRNSHRQSIALGLERLPVYPQGDGSWSPALSTGSGGRPVSRAISPMSFSGNSRYSVTARTRSRGGDIAPENKGSTFDDILGPVATGKKKGKR